MNRLRFELQYRRERWTERAAMFVVWHLLPRTVIKWAVVRAFAWAWADAGNKVPDELTYTEVCSAVERER